MAKKAKTKTKSKDKETKKRGPAKKAAGAVKKKTLAKKAAKKATKAKTKKVAPKKTVTKTAKKTAKSPAKKAAKKTVKKVAKKVAKKGAVKKLASKTKKVAATKTAKKSAPKSKSAGKTARKSVTSAKTVKTTKATKTIKVAKKAAKTTKSVKAKVKPIVQTLQLPPPARVKTSRAGHRPKTERAQKGRPNTAHQMSARTAVTQPTSSHPHIESQDSGLTPSELSTTVSRALGAVAAFLRTEEPYTSLVSDAEEAQKALHDVYMWLHSAAPLDNGVVLDEDVLRHYAQTALVGHLSKILQLFPEHLNDAEAFLKNDVLEFFLARMAMTDFEAL
jgi:hypothetical protein